MSEGVRYYFNRKIVVDVRAGRPCSLGWRGTARRRDRRSSEKGWDEGECTNDEDAVEVHLELAVFDDLQVARRVVETGDEAESRWIDVGAVREEGFWNALKWKNTEPVSYKIIQ